MFRQSVNSDTTRYISAGFQLQISNPARMSQSVQPRERRASECDGTAMSSEALRSAPAADGAARRPLDDTVNSLIGEQPLPSCKHQIESRDTRGTPASSAGAP